MLSFSSSRTSLLSFPLLAACAASGDDTATSLSAPQELGAYASAESVGGATGFMVNWQLSGPWTNTCTFNATNTATLNGYVTDGSIPSSTAFVSGALVLTAKLQYALGGAAPSIGTVCGDMLSALAWVPRQGDCPEYTGNAVKTKNIALTNAMNYVQSTYSTGMTGVWCKVELTGGAAADPQNLWYSLMYGFQNYTAAGVVHWGSYSPAIYRLRYFVPQAAATAYNAFLTNPILAAAYPTGSTFNLSLQNVSSSTNGAVSTTIPTLSGDDTWSIVDPDPVEDALKGFDRYVDAMVDQGVTVGTTCTGATGFPFRGTDRVASAGWGRLQREPACR